MAKEIELLDRYEQINKVAQMYIKGMTNPTSISKELGLKRSEAIELIEEWKEIARGNDDIKAKAAEALQQGIQHNTMNKERFWETDEQPDTAAD